MEYPAGQTQQQALRNWLGRWQALQGDKYTGALAAIPIEHLMIHASRFFTAPDIDNDVDIASPKEWLFVTPNDDELEVHMVFGIVSSAQCIVELFEAAETSADGTEVTPVNHHRTSEYESLVAVYADPTVTDAGDLIDVKGVGSTGGAVKIGGETRGEEWDIKPNTKYLLRVTVGANDETVALSAGWYEFHEDDLTWEEPSSSSSSA